jgi:SAM-dependent methyltransferase
MSASSANSVANESQTLWEHAADTRWGQYLSQIEQDAILRGHREFAAPAIGLEIGCEGGRWCRLLSSLGWQMTGTDVNPETLRLCQLRSPEVRCILVDATDEHFPAADQSIDLLLVMECPVIESPWFAAEARRVLQPGGVLVGNLLNRSSWRGLAANFKSDLLHRPRYYAASYSNLHASLVENGFQFLFERGYGWAPFGRMSNSTWIPAAASCEHHLHLNRLITFSPWIAFVAKLN